MKAGDLDRLVQFRRASLSDDGFTSIETFADHGSPVWAKKADLSDGERLRAGEVSAVITTRFTVRYSAFSADLTPKDELSCEGRTYAIFGIKEVGGRRRWLEITCSSRSDK